MKMRDQTDDFCIKVRYLLGRGAGKLGGTPSFGFNGDLPLKEVSFSKRRAGVVVSTFDFIVFKLFSLGKKLCSTLSLFKY